MNARNSSVSPVDTTENGTLDVLVVDDEAVFAKAVGRRLAGAGYTPRIAGTVDEARQAIRDSTPDMILLDMRLPDGSGMDLLAHLAEGGDAAIPVVVLTAYGGLEDAVSAMKLGAADYLKKPVDLDELILAVEKVLSKAELGRRLEYSLERESHALEGEQLLGEAPGINRVRQEIERLSGLSASAGAPPTVLILGETGTGKDLTARLLHLNSTRGARPFVHVDCAALPPHLFESELFGHEKGAFTSAHAARTGLIEAAEDGTVYLDEVAEIPPELQPKLLAVLERRTVRRVGSSRERPVRAWFIAGTNRPLEDMIREGRFRSDLYYRLKVLTILMPPLRGRGSDIALLAGEFARRTAKRFGVPRPDFGSDALSVMRDYGWPGNVRELAHLVERAVLLSGGTRISAADLMLEGAAVEQADTALHALDELTLGEAEAMLIERALSRTGGNVSEAARRLGVTRMALRYRMKHHGISRPD